MVGGEPYSGRRVAKIRGRCMHLGCFGAAQPTKCATFYFLFHDEERGENLSMIEKHEKGSSLDDPISALDAHAVEPSFGAVGV